MNTHTDTEFDDLVELHKKLAELSVSARQIADTSGLSRREIAVRMGHASPSTVQRLLGGMAYNATVETLAKFAWACGHDFDVRFYRFQDKKSSASGGVVIDFEVARESLKWRDASPRAGRVQYDCCVG